MSNEERWELYKQNMTFLPFAGAEDQLKSEVLQSRRVDEEEIPDSAIETPIRNVVDSLYPHIISIVDQCSAQFLKHQHVLAALEVSTEINLQKDFAPSMFKHNGFEQDLLRLVEDFQTIIAKQKQAALLANALSDSQARRLILSHSALPDFHS